MLSYAVDYIDMLSHLRVGVSVPVCVTLLPNVFSSGMLWSIGQRKEGVHERRKDELRPLSMVTDDREEGVLTHSPFNNLRESLYGNRLCLFFAYSLLLGITRTQRISIKWTGTQWRHGSDRIPSGEWLFQIAQSITTPAVKMKKIKRNCFVYFLLYKNCVLCPCSVYVEASDFFDFKR